ncbi:Uncharacterised protein [Mycobacteroides abscessus subsp. abscessus]|nr:Uncharacterised protein [Mycobacteroides abscessus subsp. abscessus]
MAVPSMWYFLPSLVALALAPGVPSENASDCPLRLPRPADFTVGESPSVTTAPKPWAPLPMTILTLPFEDWQTTAPSIFCSLPSMVTLALLSAREHRGLSRR